MNKDGSTGIPADKQNEQRHLRERVTELKAELEALKRLSDSHMLSEHLYQILSYSTNLFYRHTADHVLTYLSPQSIEFLGYPPEKAMVRWTKFATDNPINEAGFQSTVRAIETGKPQPPYELELQHRDGRLLRVEVREAPVVEVGRTVAIVGSLTDITERKKVEDELRRSEERFRLLVKESPLPMLVTHLDQSIVEMNRKFTEMFGYTMDDVWDLESWWPKAYPDPDYRKQIQEKWGRVMADAEAAGRAVTHSVEADIVCKSGAVRTVDVSLTRQSDRMLVVFVDLTERKKVQAALEESERTFRSIIENAPFAIYIYELMADNRLVFSGYNAAADLKVGTDNSRFLGMTIEEAFPLLVETDLPDRYRKVARDGENWYCDEFSYDQGDIHGIFEVFVFQMSPGKAAVVFNNITERKQMEEERVQLEAQLRQSQKMEAIGNLAGGVAHDFNNLLQVIKGYTELALSRLEPDHPAHEAMAQVDRAGNRAAELVSQLLAFGRRTMMQPVPVSLNQVLTESTRMLRRIIGEDIELHFDPDAVLPAIHADQGMLEQVLMNLCVNARDAMPDGGSLNISTRLVQFDEPVSLGPGPDVEGTFVLLQVEDSGIGMEPEIESRIFEPFFTTKEVGQGTGLGLAMVYGIVKQHGGYIYCDTEKDRGTRFDIYLPAIEDAVERNKSATENQDVRGHETILLAEDEEMVRSVAAEMLKSAGYRVLVAKDGEQAVRMFQANQSHIELVMLDVLMPNITGTQAWRKMRELGANVPVLFISGYSEDRVQQDLPEALGHLIQKPFDRKILLTAVQEALSGT